MQKATLPVTRNVNVQVTMSPRATAGRNFGAMLILGATDVIDVDQRVRSYANIADVVADFGTEAPEHLAAMAFFAQSPKPTTLQIGRWAKNATTGALVGRVLAGEELKASNFTGISAGNVTFVIDGEQVALSGIDLSNETNLNGVASKLEEALQSKGFVKFDGKRFVVTSASTGTDSKVTVQETSDMGDKLGFGVGARSVDGAQAETLEKAVAEMVKRPNWYGLIIAEPVDAETAVKSAGLIEASEVKHVIGFTSQDSRELDPMNDESLGAKLKANGFKRSIVQFSSHHPQAVASVFGRMATVKFEGSNTTITLKFKQEPSVIAENLDTESDKALTAKNINVFAAYNNDSAILQEGVTSSGDFIDEIHGLDWLESTVQNQIWNLLYTTATKVGQDEQGMAQLRAVINKALDKGVNNGLIGAGVWNGDEFGLLKKGDVLPTGYYVYMEPLEEQLQADREARKAPMTQIAVKLKGAIHFVDVSITVNR